MILLVHILIALGSALFTTHLLFHPTRRKVTVSWVLVAATLISGTWLVVATGAPMLKACMTGLLYVGLITTGTLAAKGRLQEQVSTTRKEPSKTEWF